MDKTVLKIEGITCEHCKATVAKALLAAPGIIGVAVNLAKTEAAIVGSASRGDLATAVEDADYTVIHHRRIS